MLRLDGDNEPIDPVTLGKTFQGKDWQVYFTDLVRAVPAASNIQYYARIVKDLAVKRHLIRMANSLSTELQHPRSDVFEVKTRFRKKFDAIGEADSNTERPFTLLSDLLKEPKEVQDWVADNTLITGGLSMLAAKPKVGKSTLARNLARAVARGDDFIGRATKRGPVIYCELEEKRDQVGDHYRRMGANRDGDQAIWIHFSSGTDELLDTLRAAIVEHKAVLAVVDPLFRLITIKDASAYAEVGEKLKPVHALARETGCHVMVIHHLGKGDRDDGDQVLGSTVLFGTVDTLLCMRKREHYRTLSSSQRYGRNIEGMALSFDEKTGVIGAAGSVQDAEDLDTIDAIKGLMAGRNEW
jgi:hypothetical protein